MDEEDKTKIYILLEKVSQTTGRDYGEFYVSLKMYQAGHELAQSLGPDDGYKVMTTSWERVMEAYFSTDLEQYGLPITTFALPPVRLETGFPNVGNTFKRTSKL